MERLFGLDDTPGTNDYGEGDGVFQWFEYGTLNPSESVVINVTVDYQDWQTGTHNEVIVINNRNNSSQSETVNVEVVINKTNASIIYGVPKISRGWRLWCGLFSSHFCVLGLYPDSAGITYWNLIDKGNYKTGDVGPTDHNDWKWYGDYPPERPLTETGLIARLRVLTNWYLKGESFTDSNGNGIIDWQDNGCDNQPNSGATKQEIISTRVARLVSLS